MGINLAGRRRKRLALGLLAAGFAGVTALGGAMAASAEEPPPVLSGHHQRTREAAQADIPGLQAQCRAKGGTPGLQEVLTLPRAGNDTSPELYVAQIRCNPLDPNRDRDFFSPV